MKRTLCLLLVSGASACLRGLIPEASAQAKDPPPPVYNAPAQPPSQPSAAPAASAPVPPPSAPAQRSAAELEKLVMPIALHPDPLIAILLPASAYPLEIVQAARFVKDTNNIAKVDAQPWDDNVKELAKFPDLIAKMDADLSWTVELGQAFVDQPKELMDTIQALRTKAHAAGTLRSSSQQIVNVTNIVVIQSNFTQIVTVTNQIVEVVPSNPQIIYVPSYPITVYYPPPAYVYNPMVPLVTFGVGMACGAIWANNCNWGYGHVDVDIDVDRNVNRNVDRNTDRTGNRASNTGQKQWKPDQNRMSKAGSPGAAQSREARGWGGSGSSSQPAQRPSAGAGTRPSPTTTRAPSAGASPSISSRPSSGGAGGGSVSSRQQPSVNRSSPSQGHSPSAFGGSSSGSSARGASSRGSSSRGGGFGGGGGRGGGGRGGGRGR